MSALTNQLANDLEQGLRVLVSQLEKQGLEDGDVLDVGQLGDMLSRLDPGSVEPKQHQRIQTLYRLALSMLHSVHAKVDAEIKRISSTQSAVGSGLSGPESIGISCNLMG